MNGQTMLIYLDKTECSFILDVLGDVRDFSSKNLESSFVEDKETKEFYRLQLETALKIRSSILTQLKLNKESR